MSFRVHATYCLYICTRKTSTLCCTVGFPGISPCMLRASRRAASKGSRLTTCLGPPQAAVPNYRSYASVVDLQNQPKPGDTLHGFTLKRSKHVPELQLSALQFEHNKTGADYLHIARDDTNNVFSIGFKTNPPDATGVPHILEHTTLCGSEK